MKKTFEVFVPYEATYVYRVEAKTAEEARKLVEDGYYEEWDTVDAEISELDSDRWQVEEVK